jgi:hypothetical protein
VHSLEDGNANKKVMKKLEDNELDVIMQVRKLGEGFDHKRLAVAAVVSIFASLSPFVQFVGRIMRVVKQNAPDDLVNRGVVVFHAGANVARRWTDFQSYTGADQEFFDALLPMGVAVLWRRLPTVAEPCKADFGANGKLAEVYGSLALSHARNA